MVMQVRREWWRQCRVLSQCLKERGGIGLRDTVCLPI